MASKAFGSERPVRPHLVQPGPGVSGEVNDLRSDIDDAFEVLEGMSASNYPFIDWVDLDSSISIGGGDITVRGQNLLNGGSVASLDKDSTHGLKFYACSPGSSGNDLTVQLVAGVATNVAYAAGALVVTFNDGVDDDDAIATAVNAGSSQARGYIRAVSSNTVNAANMSTAGAFAATSLSGAPTNPTESDWACRVSGVTALPVQSTGTAPSAPVTETSVTISVPDLTALSAPRTAYDYHELFIWANGLRSNGWGFGGFSAVSGPVLYAVDGEQPMDIDGDSLALVGANLLNESVPASLDLDSTHGLIFHACTPGTTGNSYDVIIQAGGVNTAVVAGTTLTITINGVQSDDQVATTVNASATCQGVIRAVSSGTIADVIGAGAVASTSLAGGEGADWVCKVSGATALPTQATGTAPAAPVTATTASVTVPDLTALTPPRTSADANTVYVEANGARSNTAMLRSTCRNLTNILYVDAAYAGSDSDGTLEKPYTTLTSAIAATTTGDVVRVAPGAYVEPGTITPVSGAPIIGLCSARSGGVVVTNGGGAPVLTLTGNGSFFLENLSFIDDGASGDNTVAVTGADSTVVYFEGCNINVTVGGASAVQWTNANAVATFNNCALSNAGSASPVVNVTQASAVNFADSSAIHATSTESSFTFTGAGAITSRIVNSILQGDIDVQAAVVDPSVTVTGTQLTTGNVVAISNAGAVPVTVFDCKVSCGHATTAFGGAGAGGFILDESTVCLSTGDEVASTSALAHAARPGFDHGRAAVAGAAPQTVACTFNHLQPDTNYTAQATFEDNGGAVVDVYLVIDSASKTTADFDVTINSIGGGAIDGVINWTIHHD